MKSKRNYFQFFNRTFPSWKNLILAFFIICIIVVSINIFFFDRKANSTKKELDYEDLNRRILRISLPRDLNFSGEMVPQNDFGVRESIDREFIDNSYWRSNAIMLFKRANRWFPIIEPILKKYGVPDDFKYLAVAESNLTNALSPQGAAGFWQIIKPTAKSLGLEVNETVDERYHVQKSTEAACKYILKAFDRFNNWTLAAASYNMGMGGLELQLQKQQVNSYYDLLLNEETSRYIFRIIAIKNIHKNPKHYGFELNQKDLYPYIPTVKFEVTKDIPNLALFATSKGYSFKILKIFNPWIRKSFLKTDSKKKYILHLPEKKYLSHSFDEVEKDVLYKKKRKDNSKNNAVDSNQTLIHIVVQGESIQSIAQKYAVKVEELCMWNRLSEDEKLLDGLELLIYVGGE